MIHPYLYVKRVRAVREHPARRLALVLGGLELLRYDRGRVGQVGQAAIDPVEKINVLPISKTQEFYT